jgi:hypothetical protein
MFRASRGQNSRCGQHDHPRQMARAVVAVEQAVDVSVDVSVVAAVPYSLECAHEPGTIANERGLQNRALILGT